MTLYPLFINLQSLSVLVVGAGEVGTRKVSALLACNPQRITVIDPHPPAETAQHLYSSASVTLHTRNFSPRDIDGHSLVFAATSASSVNATIADLCHAKHILCNIADDPDKSTFAVPAHFRQGPITVAISTEGLSPALARRIRQETEAWFDNRYTKLAVVLGRLRPLALATLSSTHERTTLFRHLVNSELTVHLAANDYTAAHALLTNILPQTLHASIGDLLHEL